MFRRSSVSNDHDIAEPDYKADLSSLGFKFNIDEFIRIGPNREYFDFHHTDNERENILRKEAMHASVRRVIMERLNGFGLTQVYLHGNDMHRKKPEGAHVSILTTDQSGLSQRKDVLIVVGEHSQDLGVWSWRLLLREHGVTKGGAMGLAGMVQAYGLSQRGDLEESLEEKIGPLAPFHGNWAVEGSEEEAAMGVIVLNPGQLLYSPLQHTCMTHTTWQARRRANALADEFEIDEKYNRVPGHTNPKQHIRTFFDAILPRLVCEDTRLYVVGIADGADYLLEYLDEQLAANPSDPATCKIQGLALIQSNHNPRAVTARDLRNLLQDPNRARAWVISDEPRGKLINRIANLVPPGDSFVSDEDISTPTPSDMATPTRAKSITEPSTDVLEPGHHLPEAEDDGESAAFELGQVPSICNTFSSGEPEILENVWPSVMGDVLTFFSGCQKFATRRRIQAHAQRRRLDQETSHSPNITDTMQSC